MSKSITYLLALAVSSSLLVAQDTKAAGGWTAKPGSGLTYDSDTFSLKWSNRLQVHWVVTDNDNNTPVDTSSFTVRRARTNLTGHVFNKNVTYNLTLDAVDAGAAGDGNIKNGWAQWNFVANDDGAIGLRVGQGKTQFGLEFTWTSAGLWFVERSLASRTFADARSRGAWINGMVMKERPIRFSVGAMNTDVSRVAATTDVGEETANSDNELSYVLAANFDPLGDFHGGKQTRESHRQGDWRTDDDSLKGTVGFALGLGNGKAAAVAPATVGQDIESTSLNINTAWTVARINLLGEFFTRTDDVQGAAVDKEEPSGFSVSAGYLLDKSGDSAIQWGFGIRFSAIELDAGNNAALNFIGSGAGNGTSAVGDVSEISAVVNAFYHGHNCKTQLELTSQEAEPTGLPSRTNLIVRIGFQIEF